MKEKSEGVGKLIESFAAFLEKEQEKTQAAITDLLDAVKAFQAGTQDRRLVRIIADLKELRRSSDLSAEMFLRDFLPKIEKEAEQLESGLRNSRVAGVVSGLIQTQPHSLTALCETVLDGLIEATGAGRGFLLLYLPESTEAEIIAARSFQSNNLSLEEYALSRTLLRQALRTGTPILVRDASSDPVYSERLSVASHELKSILAVPIKRRDRIIGAVYLDNRAIASAFDDEDRDLVDSISRFASFYMHHAHLVPVAFERDRRVYLDSNQASKEILGTDPRILAAVNTIRRIAPSNAPVLIEGETGTGKELVARALHSQSARAGSFIAINCASIPENLFESELFGHERGAFTGATERFIGHIQEADGGTFFFDEISELPYPMQAKLLRFLQSQEFQRLGGKEIIKVDVRVVAATSRNLKGMIDAGKFQDALYYRLNVIPLELPPLRNRKRDIALLAEHFVHKYSEIYKKDAELESGVYDLLEEYEFPGNVRELENLVHRLVALSQGGSIGVRDLPRELRDREAHLISLDGNRLDLIFPNPPSGFEEIRRREGMVMRAFGEQRRRLAELAVQAAGGNVTEAAARLGIHRVTLHKILGREKSYEK